jgi:hypothetical protein
MENLTNITVVSYVLLIELLQTEYRTLRENLTVRVFVSL